MNLVKKILIGHNDARVRRRLVLLLADAGFDVRAFATAEAAAEDARDEWFDLAVVAPDLPGAPGFSFVDRLKKLQPTVRVLLLVTELDLSLVVQAIRLSVADVVALGDDPRVVLRRIQLLFGTESTPPGDGVTLEELTQVETMLESLPPGGATSADPFGVHTHEPGADLLQVSKEKAVLEARFNRLQREKAALESELKTLLSQGAAAARLQAEFDELHTERELAEATQAAIDEKARRLAETRAAIASERSTLEAELTAWRQRLGAEEDRLATEAARFHQEVKQFNQARRRWQEDADVLRTQEENLRAYEARLREIQRQLEADRVLWSSAAKPPSSSPATDDAALQQAWLKLQRASELFESERNNFRDDRVAIEEQHQAVKLREEHVRDREIQVALYAKQLSALPPPGARAAAKTLPRAPLDVVRTFFGAEKKA
ncbi:MAG: response regulator [Pedosphaera sp.]|nr:response regulator [Pedosphaera sp.]